MSAATMVRRARAVINVLRGRTTVYRATGTIGALTNGAYFVECRLGAAVKGVTR